MIQIKQLLTAFERYAYGQSLHTAFTQMLDWTLLPFKKYDSAAEQQLALETYQTHPKAQQLAQLITLIGEASEGFCDPLGELYQQAISNGHSGQYWTPEPLCDMMATMQIDRDLQRNQTVYDCACGSGRMLLATAKINRHLLLYGADLDLTCCKMALLNMLLNSLQGEVAHMNTLSNDFYMGYKVSTILVDNHHIPYYTEFTDPQQSRIWLRPLKENDTKPKFDKLFEPVQSEKPINGVQGTLF